MYEDIFEEETEFSAEMVDAIETYEGLRAILGEEYSDAEYDELDAIFMEITADMSAEEAEFFKKFIKKVGRGLSKAGRAVAKVARPIARAISPIAKVALPAVGTIFGGPVGALAGQAGATLLGQLGKGGGRRARPSRRRPRRRGRGRTRRRPSRAAGRLAGLLQSPQLRQALGSLVAGGRGRGSVRVGRTNIPVGALANLAGTLFAQAAEDAEALHGTTALPEYLTDENGEAIEGIESAEFRAERLWDVLMSEGLIEDAIAAEDDDEDEMIEWQDDFFDAFEPLH